jgi:Zn-dependent protease
VPAGRFCARASRTPTVIRTARLRLCGTGEAPATTRTVVAPALCYKSRNMASAQRGSIRLFGFSGIEVFLHWSWFLVAVYEINIRAGVYSSVTWNILEYLALFLIVLMHEFGHALACRQVGGTANRIMLWPLGGVAYVDPPQRAGATLWSIAAGPLVNVLLLPVLWGLASLGDSWGGNTTSPDVSKLLQEVLRIDLWLLIFNILPVYPLDGGQILRSLLWFVMGKARSLMAAVVIGVLGVGGFILLAVRTGNAWLGIISLYLLMSCWSGFRQAQALLRFAKLPRRDGFACPSCKMTPPVGNLWKCGRCGQAFDMFQTHGVCPQCGTQFQGTGCLDCGATHSMSEWAASAVAPQNL